MPRRRLSLAALAVLAVQATASAQAPISPQTAQKLAQGTFREYLELLSLPNDAIHPPDIQKNVDFLERAFRKRGFTILAETRDDEAAIRRRTGIKAAEIVGANLQEAL